MDKFAVCHDLCKVADLREREAKFFKVGNKNLAYNPQEISLVLGLPYNGTIVNFKKAKSNTRDHYLVDCNLTRTSIYKKIRDIIEEDVEGSVKLLVLFLFASVLFPTKHFGIKAGLCHYVDDLNKSWDYAWDQVVYDFMFWKEIMRRI